MQVSSSPPACNAQKNLCSVKISIIIPFYNIEDYAAKCLDSVLEQDMPDFEIIAVNDGSTDKTPSILKEYAQKDSRVYILNLQNGGLSWARNQGVLKATGEYIMFIDGDDFILPGSLSKLYNYIKVNNADVVISSYLSQKYGNIDEQLQRPYPKETLMDSLTAAKILLLSGDFSVCNKIINRKFYLEKNICFEEGVLLEDIPVSFQMMCKAQRIFYIDALFYVYVQRQTSILNVMTTFKKIYDYIHAFDRIKEELPKTVYEYELNDIFDSVYIKYLINLLITCYKNSKKFNSQEDLKNVELFLKDRLSKISFSHLFKNPYLRGSYKLKAFRLKSGLYKWEKAICRKLKKI